MQARANRTTGLRNTVRATHQNIMMDQSIVCGPLSAVLASPPSRHGE
jgi:hypothetical protein